MHSIIHTLAAALSQHREVLSCAAPGYPDADPPAADRIAHESRLAATRAAIDAALLALAEEQGQPAGVLLALRAPGWVRVAVLRRGYWTAGSDLTRENCRAASDWRLRAIETALTHSPACPEINAH